MHVFHWLHHGDGRLLATGEHMLLHVSLKTRSAASLNRMSAEAHRTSRPAGRRKLPAPGGARPGSVGQTEVK